MDIEGIEKKRIHGLIRSQRSDGDIKGAGDDRTNSQQFEKMLPLMEPKQMAKHKRCVSFKDQERSMPMLGSFTRKLQQRSDFDALSKNSETLDEVGEAHEKSQDNPKSTVTGRREGYPSKKPGVTQSTFIDIERSTEAFADPSGSKSGLRNSARLVKPASFVNHLNDIKNSEEKIKSIKAVWKADSKAEDMEMERETELLQVYIDCLERATEGQDILRQQAMTIFRLESEVRQLEFKISSNDRERTILESIDGSSFRTRTQDGRQLSELSSHKTLLQYKNKLQEVNRQLDLIEEKRKLIYSLEHDLEKLEQKRASLGEAMRQEEDTRRLEEVELAH
jgi:hypothetical protein